MKHYCVISHTHWDREWYQTQEEFRMRLIDLMDHLLDILDEDPDYIFHMDAQTIVFEDYWEVRPEMKEKCCKYIKEGRIIAGPWYVQNDFYLTSGEATVRNLLLGTHQAEEMGACSKNGYTPDQFGLISQLPQILKGFEIDHCIFGRGYATDYVNEDGELVRKNKPSEFLWRSPDGSEVLGICLTHWYNNAQRFSADIDKALKLTKNIEESFEGIATTPYLLLMNGVDHLEAQPDLLPILKEVQKRLPEDQKIYQTTMQEYVNLVKGALKKEEMNVETGELMQSIAAASTLKDTASSRTYLKRANSEIQNLLENRLEPLYSLLELSGMKGVYPAGHLDYLWKMLIRNHAHDSICGCSKDAVHRQMEDRFARILEMGEELHRRGMRQLANHVRAGFKSNDYQIVVFNSLEHDRTEVIDAKIDIVVTDEPKGIRITDAKGMEVPFVVLEKKEYVKSVLTPINLPGRLPTICYSVRMLAENVPAFGYLVYKVETLFETKEFSEGARIGYVKEADYCLENEYLKVIVTMDGKVSLADKENGQVYEDILEYQDVADVGNAYNFIPAKEETPIHLAAQAVPEISMEESDAYVGKICMQYQFALPEECDEETQVRSKELVTVPVKLMLTLEKESKKVDLKFEVENHAKDHFLQVLIRTGINSDVVMASSPYDVVSRNKWDLDTRVQSETEHTSGMVFISDGKKGIAILNRGIYCYQHLQKENGTIAFPLVRSTGRICSTFVKGSDDLWNIPENQNLCKLESELSIMPQKGDVQPENALFAAKAYQNPLMVQSEPVDTKKFLGGRPAVQDTTIAELFYQKVPYGEVELKQDGFGVKLEGEGLQVAAFKKSFDKKGYIFRFYNAKEEPVQAKVLFGNLNVQQVWKTNLCEKAREVVRVKEKGVFVEVKAKEIVTLYFE